jgi:hypothetical protein
MGQTGHRGAHPLTINREGLVSNDFDADSDEPT